MSTSKTIEQALDTIRGGSKIKVEPGMLLRKKSDPQDLRLALSVNKESVLVCLHTVKSMKFSVDLGYSYPLSYWEFTTGEWEVVDVLEHVYVR